MKTNDIQNLENNANKENCIHKAQEKSANFFLYISTAIASFNLLSFGMMSIWISPIASRFLSDDVNDNPLERAVTTLELSVLGSLGSLGIIFGPVLIGKGFDAFGRKKFLNIICILVSIGFMILGFSKSIYLYYLILPVIGILLGASYMGLPIYISEITEDVNRGQFICIVASALPLGNLYTLLLGWFLSVKLFVLLCAAPSLFTLVLSLICLPESPHYLIMKQERERAVKVLEKLLCVNRSRAEEMADKIQLSLTKTNKNKENVLKFLLTDKSSRCALFKSCFLFTMTTLTGLHATMSYLGLILEEIGMGVYSFVFVTILCLTQIIAYIVASVVIEKWGRRPLLIFSTLFCTLLLGFLGGYFYLLGIGSPWIQKYFWIPACSIIVLILTSIFGISSVCMTFSNEVFASNIKSTALSIVTLVGGLTIVGTIFLFPLIMKSFGLSNCFLCFAVFTLLGSIYSFFCIPETKGKNIFEIQQMLLKG